MSSADLSGYPFTAFNFSVEITVDAASLRMRRAGAEPGD
jgi:hypothetical protein